MFSNKKEEMLLTSPNATPHSLRENKGGPYFWLGLISYRHLILGQALRRSYKKISVF